MRFHQLHGKNILLDEQKVVATRTNSFTHAMIFSERPLYPGELFMVEIEDITDRWTGHIKIGFTYVPPNEILEQCHEDVVYDHVLQITVPNRSINQCACSCGLYRPLFNMGTNDEYIHTPFASISRQAILPIRKQNSDPINTYPTSVGSRIGVVYIYKEKSIHMHCILNGYDYGPFSILKIPSSSIEYSDILIPSEKRQRTCLLSDPSIDKYTKFWAFIDVYGATKRVRIVQLYGPSPLKSLCRSAILSHVTSYDQINEFHLGHQLKSYLKFHSI